MCTSQALGWGLQGQHPLYPVATQGQHLRGSLSRAPLAQSEECRTQKPKRFTKKTKVGQSFHAWSASGGHMCHRSSSTPLPGVRSQGRASPSFPEVAGVLPKLQWRSRTVGGVAQGWGSRGAQLAEDPSKGKAVTAPQTRKARPGEC